MNDLDEKDWIIIRLLRLLLQTGDFSNHPDIVKSIQWFEQAHRDYGHEDIGDGDTMFGPIYGTGHAKLVEGIKLAKDTPTYDRETGVWR